MAINSKKQNYSKTVYRYFSLADFEQEQEYLRRQHQAGWKLEKIMYAGFYRFTRTEPEDVIYQLDFMMITQWTKKTISNCSAIAVGNISGITVNGVIFASQPAKPMITKKFSAMSSRSCK
jgi:hypothetical protein